MVFRRRRGPHYFYWLQPRRLILLAVLVALLAFGAAFAVGMATSSNSGTKTARSATPASLAAAKHSTASKVKIETINSGAGVPGMATKPVHHATAVATVTPPTSTHTARPPATTTLPTIPTPSTTPPQTATPPASNGGGGGSSGSGGSGSHGGSGGNGGSGTSSGGESGSGGSSGGGTGTVTGGG